MRYWAWRSRLSDAIWGLEKALRLMQYRAWRSRLSDVIWGLEKALLSDAIRGLEKPCCLMRKNKFMRDHLYRKNEIVTVAIEDMTGDGEGIGHVDRSKT